MSEGGMSRRVMSRVVFGLCVLLLVQGASTAAAQDEIERKFAKTTLSGTVTGPKGRPLAGATLRFLSTGETPRVFSTTSDENGRFVLDELPYGTYAFELRTADDERVHGVRQFTMGGANEAFLEMSLSLRVVSKTTMYSEPRNFQFDVERETVKWGRFWKQFGIFFGAALTGGLVI